MKTSFIFLLNAALVPQLTLRFTREQTPSHCWVETRAETRRRVRLPPSLSLSLPLICEYTRGSRRYAPEPTSKKTPFTSTTNSRKRGRKTNLSEISRFDGNLLRGGRCYRKLKVFAARWKFSRASVQRSERFIKCSSREHAECLEEVY